jgi:ABC-2 type transport system permease protein
VILYGMIAMFLLSALGGAWFPLEITGETFFAVGHLMPSAWAMEGVQNLILRGRGFGSILMPAAVLIGYGVAFLAAAVWRFKSD